MEDTTQQAPASQRIDAHIEAAPRARRAPAGLAVRLQHALSVLQSAARLAYTDAGAELLLIFCWTIVIVAPYTNMSLFAAPRGIEYYTLIQSNHVWTRFQECGWCVLWNGSVRGGAPTFVDPHASLLHPLVIVTTLLFGVINGSKLALIVAFFMAGVAQWWLLRVLGVGQIARVWAAGMAVAAGFLAAQMSEGLFSMVISAVSCALVLPPLVSLALTGSRRAAVALGVTLALALLAGQAYMQFGLGLLMPLALVLPRPEGMSWGTLLRRYALALLLALLLAAPFLVPFMHFLPELHKNADREFAGAQPLTYVLFNLVISDHSVYLTDQLGKQPYPFLYANYIGWVPIALALWGLRGSRDRRERRAKLFLASMAALALWVASATPLRWLTHMDVLQALADTVAGFRNCSLIAGLAIPPLLALAAIGLERLLDARWLRLGLTLTSDWGSSRAVAVDLRWLLVAPLALALLQASSFGKGWIETDRYPIEVAPAVEALRTPTLQWVNTPVGDNPYEQIAIAGQFKLAYGFRAWDWNGRALPSAVRMLAHQDQLPDLIKQASLGIVNLYAAPPGVEYATLMRPDGTQKPCAASGIDGMIDVLCDSPGDGELLVAENSWDGWRAWVDGQPAPLKPALQLAVGLPAGRHTVSFRYMPWDVPLGLGLCLLGLALAIYLWRRGAPTPMAPATEPDCN